MQTGVMQPLADWVCAAWACGLHNVLMNQQGRMTSCALVLPMQLVADLLACLLQQQ